VRSINSLHEPLNGLLNCSRQIAHVAPNVIHAVDNEHNFDAIRRGWRDVPYLIKKTMAALRSAGANNAQADEMQHQLNAVHDDTKDLAEWIRPAWEQIEAIRKGIHTDSGFDSKANTEWNIAKTKADELCHKKAQAVFESCNRAQIAANQICTAIDKAAKDKQSAIENEPDKSIYLLAAIDELIAFVHAHYLEVLNPRRELDEAEWRMLMDLEGRVIGLLSQVANELMTSLIQTNPTPSQTGGVWPNLYRYTPTGIKYLFSGRGREIDRDDVWEPKMYALRAAVQSAVGEHAALNHQKDTLVSEGQDNGERSQPIAELLKHGTPIPPDPPREVKSDHDRLILALAKMKQYLIDNPATEYGKRLIQLDAQVEHFATRLNLQFPHVNLDLGDSGSTEGFCQVPCDHGIVKVMLQQRYGLGDGRTHSRWVIFVAWERYFERFVELVKMAKQNASSNTHDDLSPALNREKKKKRTAKRKLGSGGRPRSSEVEEVQKYIYERWIKGDKLAAIRNSAEKEFGVNRAPVEDAHVTQAAKRYAEKHGLSVDRKSK
jgi:hypothetical protein